MLRLARLISIGYLVLCVAAVGWTVAIGPLGYAPFPLPFGPSRAQINISIAASSETQAWLEEASRRFAQTNAKVDGRPIAIMIESAGSNAIGQAIAAGTRTPVVFLPASTAQVELLRAAWQQPGDIVGSGSDAPQSLASSPLVIVAWQERANVLWPNGPTNPWSELHDAVVDPDGWKRLGKPEWGAIKFGHARPTTANSGLQILLSLAATYGNKTVALSNADIAEPAFQQWLLDFEQNVAAFDDSTSSLMTDMVRFGPSKYDFVAAYESLAVQSFDSAQSRGGALHVYYPPAMILSDYPYTILNAPWVSAEQRRAGEVFRDYLLSLPIQQLALQYGFRPANQAIAVTSADATNPFVKYKANGLLTNLSQPVQLPPAEVLNGLTQLWQQKVNR